MIAGIIRVLFNMLLKRTYIKNPNCEALTEAQQRALSIGAVLSINNFEYYNSLRTCRAGKDAKSLKESWGITTKDEAVDTLEWLKNEGHRKAFNEFLHNAADAFSPRSIGKYNFTQLDNLKEALPELCQRGFVGGPGALPEEDFRASMLENINAAAWDMGRMVNVARWCYDNGYISEEQAWEYILAAESESASVYSGWEEFGKSYIIGRALWNGADGAGLSCFMDIVEKLLKDAKSPWVLFPFISRAKEEKEAVI